MSDTVAAGQLRAFVERIERIEAEIKEMNADKSEIYKELRGFGFDVKAVRQCVSARKLEMSELQERNAIFDMYWEALTGSSRVHVHEEQISDGPKSRPGDAAASLTQQSNSPRQESPSAQERSSDRSGGQFGDAPKPAHIPDEPDSEADASGEYKRVMPASVLPDLTDGDTDAGGLSRSANSSEDVPAFLLKDRKPLRPHCQHPDDLEKCAGSGRDHCHACTKAMADSEAA